MSISNFDVDSFDNEVICVDKNISNTEFHMHEKAQLSYTIEGVMYVNIQNYLYIVPPHMAIFIPQGLEHKALMHKALKVKGIYFSNKYINGLPKTAQLINLSELSKILITTICSLNPEDLNSRKNLISVLLDEIKNSDKINYAVKIPKEPRIYKIYKLFQNKTDTAYPSIEESAAHVNTSSKTLTRLFKKDTGLSFILWKQQFIFIKSLELLQKYKRTTIVAYKLGYNSDSAFISMFKRLSGGKLPSYFFAKTKD